LISIKTIVFTRYIFGIVKSIDGFIEKRYRNGKLKALIGLSTIESALHDILFDDSLA